MRDSTALSISEQRVLEAGRAALGERHAAQGARFAEAQRFDARRRRVATRFRERFRSKAIELLGPDLGRVTARQERDRETVIRFVEARSEQARHRVSPLNRPGSMDDRARFHLRSGWTERPPASPSPTFEFVRTATQIEVRRSLPIDIPDTPSMAANRNEVQTGFAISRAAGGEQAESLTVMWHFLWTPARAGFLDVVAPLETRGSHWREAHGDCLNGARATCGVTCELALFQLDSQGAAVGGHVGLPVYAGETTVETVSSATEWGDHVFDDTAYLVDDQFLWVDAGQPVLVSVTLETRMRVNHATASIAYGGSNGGLNVPFVFMALL